MVQFNVIQVNNPTDIILEVNGTPVPGTPTALQGTPNPPSPVPTLFLGYNATGAPTLTSVSCSPVPPMTVKLQDAVTGNIYIQASQQFWGWRP